MKKIKEESFHKHFYPDEHAGICVVRRNGESTENVIRRFRKKYSKSDLVKELRERMFFEKPGDKKRRKRKQNNRARQQEQRKELEKKRLYLKTIQLNFRNKNKGIYDD